MVAAVSCPFMVTTLTKGFLVIGWNTIFKARSPTGIYCNPAVYPLHMAVQSHELNWLVSWSMTEMEEEDASQ